MQSRVAPKLAPPKWETPRVQNFKIALALMDSIAAASIMNEVRELCNIQQRRGRFDIIWILCSRHQIRTWRSITFIRSNLWPITTSQIFLRFWLSMNFITNELSPNDQAVWRWITMSFAFLKRMVKEQAGRNNWRKSEAANWRIKTWKRARHQIGVSGA